MLLVFMNCSQIEKEEIISDETYINILAEINIAQNMKVQRYITEDDYQKLIDNIFATYNVNKTMFLKKHQQVIDDEVKLLSQITNSISLIDSLEKTIKQPQK